MHALAIPSAKIEKYMVCLSHAYPSLPHVRKMGALYLYLCKPLSSCNTAPS